MAGAGLSLALPPFALADQGKARSFRIGVSLDTLAGANVNDARAAYKVWGQHVSKYLLPLKAEILPDMFVESAEMQRLIRGGLVDGFAITSWEYAKVLDHLDRSTVLLDHESAEGVEYLLVTHKASGIEKLEDLRYKPLVVHHNSLGILQNAWLSLQLAERGMPGPEQFFGGISQTDALNKVVLPVFFRATPAALLTRTAFNTAMELNPQLGRDIKVLAMSQKVTPMAFSFRRDVLPEDRNIFLQTLVKLKNTPEGLQILQLYHTRGYEERPGSVMGPTLEMIRQYEHWKVRAGAPRTK